MLGLAVDRVLAARIKGAGRMAGIAFVGGVVGDFEDGVVVR